MAHLTCITATRGEVTELLYDLKADGVENVLALRGDRNPDYPPKTEFLHADELVAFIRRRGDFGVSAACYPEGHPESPDAVSDLRYLKQKVDAGAQHLVSQLFFDNEDFLRFLERARIAGITVPIEAGLMPVLNQKSIERMVSLCGASIPRNSPASWLGTATTRRPCGRRASPMPSTRSPTWWPPGWTASTFTP